MVMIQQTQICMLWPHFSDREEERNGWRVNCNELSKHAASDQMLWSAKLRLYRPVSDHCVCNSHETGYIGSGYVITFPGILFCRNFAFVENIYHDVF